ncbi:MAG: glutathione S-transferase family protein [Halocynthiibacter sp.]
MKTAMGTGLIRLHHAHQARSMRIIWLLEEIGVPYELVVHDFFDKSMRAPDYLAISPAGRVPALEIDGRVMMESGAMLEYLCERFPEAGLGRAHGQRERMEWLDWIHYGETIGQHCANLTQGLIVLYEDWMRSPTQLKLEVRRLVKTLGRIELQLADGRDWLLAGGFSAADCAVAYPVYAGQHFIRLDDLPRTAAYWQRFAARPSFDRALPPDGARRLYSREFYEVPDA